MQQYNQDEEIEECPAGKGTGEIPIKPNQRGRDKESAWERIPNIDSENDPKSWNQNESQINSLEIRIEKMQERFNKDLEEIKKSQNIMNNA